jgi:hypothetical protein
MKGIRISSTKIILLKKYAEINDAPKKTVFLQLLPFLGVGKKMRISILTVTNFLPRTAVRESTFLSPS